MRKRDKKKRLTDDQVMWIYLIAAIGIQAGLAVMCWICEWYYNTHGYNLLPGVIIHNIIHDLKFLFR